MAEFPPIPAKGDKFFALKSGYRRRFAFAHREISFKKIGMLVNSNAVF